MCARRYIHKKIEECVDFAFSNVPEEEYHVDLLMHIAMKKGKWYLDPILMIEEIEKRLQIIQSK